MHESPEAQSPSGTSALRGIRSVGEAESLSKIALRKRALDVVGGIILVVVTAPLVLVLSLGSLIVYRSWPLFVHERVGLHGRSFHLTKIRSLPRDTPAYMTKESLPSLANKKWGVFLRRHHLDELPQFWHVVSGRMSLVGPRPEMPQLSDKLSKEFQEIRLSVLPGCTGLWQVTAASAEAIADNPKFDIYYVQNWTLRLDLWILYKTIGDLVRHSMLDSVESIPRWTKPARR